MRLSRNKFLSDDELERFMAAVRERRHVHQPRDHALFALLANTGIRPSEALALTLADLHLGARPPWIRLARPSKPGCPTPVAELTINPKVARVVGKHAPREGRLFPFTSRQAQRLFRYYCRRAEIRPRKLYSLRHSVGVKLWRHCRDIRLIQAIMGHARMKATAVYVHVAPARIAQALTDTLML